ncbi:glycosyltransferase [Candidatus Woesearchaeota archaeon]|nr:glycosyltransferase [Candidatus Woesearchaeota archaeon]
MKKKNILILLTSSYGGGAERLVLDQMKYHNRKKFNLYVRTLRKGNLEKEFINTAEKNNVDYESLDLKSRFSLIGLFRLNSMIRKNKINLVNTSLIEADMYGFFLKLLSHETKFISVRQNKNQFRKNKIFGILNYVFSLVDKKIVCVSKSVKEFINKYEYIPEKKLDVIFNAVDIKRFENTKKDKKLRKSFEYKNKKTFLIGLVGRLNKQKGHRYLFRALNILKDKRYKNIKLLVIGKGELEERLMKLRKDLGLDKEIEFLGFRKDIDKIYKILDLFCLPSDFEGLPLALMEAMASECCCLVSDIPENKELTDNKKNGLTFIRGNHKDLAEKIEDLYNNTKSRKKYSKKANEKIKKNYDIKKITKQYEELWSRLI